MAQVIEDGLEVGRTAVDEVGARGVDRPRTQLPPLRADHRRKQIKIKYDNAKRQPNSFTPTL